MIKYRFVILFVIAAIVAYFQHNESLMYLDLVLALVSFDTAYGKNHD